MTALVGRPLITFCFGVALAGGIICTLFFLTNNYLRALSNNVYISAVRSYNNMTKLPIQDKTSVMLVCSEDTFSKASVNYGNSSAQTSHAAFLPCPEKLETYSGFYRRLPWHASIVRTKQLVITDAQEVLSKPPLEDLSSIVPCNHEEADTRMLLYASNASQHGHNKIMTRQSTQMSYLLHNGCKLIINCGFRSENGNNSDTWPLMKWLPLDNRRLWHGQCFML